MLPLPSTSTPSARSGASACAQREQLRRAASSGDQASGSTGTSASG